ncbi:MAG: response regulator transcription factor [Velocimicrobium sp.]
MNILMVDDDKDLCEVTAMQLQMNGYCVDCAYDGELAKYYIKEGIYDVILLDRMLPKLDGMSLLSELRQRGVMTPIILLTALGAIYDRIEGLDAGADDYLVKPFEVDELIARIRAILRRPRERLEMEGTTFENLVLHGDTATLSCKEECRMLSKKESMLMDFFMRNANQTLSRQQILSRVWGVDSNIDEGNIDNYVYFLRRRLKALPTEVCITTIHGIGYRMERGNYV